ncbi:MAG: DUF3787 domain-containing protein [Lachnospiraceae bacterium]|nr:DUF3787 domain-containing protein [Lachnospiraceae bacterium]
MKAYENQETCIGSEINQDLAGKYNKRINNTDQLESEGTASWAETKKLVSETNVSIPDTDAVLGAKSWVDNGSRL